MPQLNGIKDAALAVRVLDGYMELADRILNAIEGKGLSPGDRAAWDAYGFEDLSKGDKIDAQPNITGQIPSSDDNEASRISPKTEGRMKSEGKRTPLPHLLRSGKR